MYDSTLILLDTLAKGNSSLASVVQPLLHVLRNADSGLVRSLSVYTHVRQIYMITDDVCRKDVTMSNDEAKTGLELMEARMLEMEARLQVRFHPSQFSLSSPTNPFSFTSRNQRKSNYIQECSPSLATRRR